jgi:hypothetical protein
MCQKNLPVNEYPGFEVECYHNVRLSILKAFQIYSPWYNSHFVNLILKSSKSEELPLIRFEEHLDIYSEVIEEKPLIPSFSDYVKSIKEVINGEEYVVVFLNWRYIESSNYYNRSDIVHECLIYGYDDQKQTFSVLAFEVDKRSFGKIEISYNVLHQEIERIIKYELIEQQWFAYYGFPISRIKCRKDISYQINYRKIFFALERGRVQGSPKIKEDFSIGFYINEYLAEYFSLISKKRHSLPTQFELWKIYNYKLLLHKQLMLQRLDYMAKELDLEKHNILKRIREFYQQTMMKIKVNHGLTLKFQETRENELLHKISEQFYKAYDQEKRAHHLFMEFLVQEHIVQYR